MNFSASSRRLTSLAFLLAFALALAALPAAAQPPVGELSVEQVAGGFDAPTALAHAGDGRLFVAERGGRVRIVDAASGARTGTFLDISGRVGAGGEQGLLGLAFHPRYADTGWLFVDYTDLAGDTVVSRFQVSADPQRADPASERVLLRIPQPFVNHNGGQLAFAPDGRLVIATGDGGSGYDPQCNGQKLDVLLGKLLRLDVDAGSAAPPYHSIPADNPFVGAAGARPEIWSYGLRNPWRFSFDRATGDLYVADVGQGLEEEIDFRPAAQAGGENFGWKVMEGTLCTGRSAGCPSEPPGCNSPELTDPVLVYDHGGGRCSVTGGHVYRGSRIAGLVGAYLYGDFCSGEVWVARRDGGVWGSQLAPFRVAGLTTFGEDAGGEIYLTGLEGDLVRLAGPAPAPQPCVEDDFTLCLAGGRFRVQATFRVGSGPTRFGTAVPISADTGYFWFFNPDNVEVIAKVLDACAAFDRFWVFAGGLTNVESELLVFDSERAEERSYPNPANTPFAPVQDTAAFATCP